jgi:hypothetical protein
MSTSFYFQPEPLPKFYPELCYNFFPELLYQQKIEELLVKLSCKASSYI